MINILKAFFLFTFLLGETFEAKGQTVYDEGSREERIIKNFGYVIEESAKPILLNSFGEEERRIAQTIQIKIINDSRSRETGANRNREIILRT